jgi:tRNA (guanine-N(7)-)-methyltransferase subunit TRM82
VRAIAFGERGVVVCGSDDKTVRGYDLATKAETAQLRRRVPKRVTAIAVDSADCVVFSDKFGDVFRFAPGTAADTEVTDEQCILGHCSMLTCMAISPDGTLIATGDRDEKVRVSRYPASHEIVSYCLAHTASVMGLIWCAGTRWLVSGGADGALYTWEPTTGRQMSVSKPAPGAIVTPAAWHAESSALAVLVEGMPHVWLYNVAAETGDLAIRCVLSPASQPLCCEFTGDGSIVAGLADGSVVALAPSADGPTSSQVYGLAAQIARAAPLAKDDQEIAAHAKAFDRAQMKRVVWSKEDQAPVSKRTKKELEPELEPEPESDS